MEKKYKIILSIVTLLLLIGITMADTIMDGSGGGNVATVDESKSLYVADVPLTQAFQNNANGQPIYIGEAAPGSLRNNSAWRIKKIDYNGVVPENVTWAGGNTSFVKIWNNRTNMYTYS